MNPVNSINIKCSLAFFSFIVQFWHFPHPHIGAMFSNHAFSFVACSSLCDSVLVSDKISLLTCQVHLVAAGFPRCCMMMNVWFTEVHLVTEIAESVHYWISYGDVYLQTVAVQICCNLSLVQSHRSALTDTGILDTTIREYLMPYFCWWFFSYWSIEYPLCFIADT